MAARTTPTLSTITTEALSKAGYPNPSTTQVTQAQNEWFGEVLNDIWTIAKPLRSMLTSATVSVIAGTSVYALPTDISSVVSMTLMDSTASTVQWPLTEITVWEHDRQETMTGTPTAYSLLNDSTFQVYPTPTEDAAIRVRYYADLTQIDLAGSLMATLYRRWENIFKQGIYAKALQKMDDNRAETEFSKYYAQLKSLILREQYGDDFHNINITVSDY